MEKLIAELKEKVIKVLDLEDITPEEIGDEDQLIGGDLGLDSIDALELVMMLESDYSVKVDNKELGEKVFSSIKSIAEFIKEKQPEKAL